MQNKISVIITTLERPGFVNDCLNSIINGEIKPYEIVLVDQSIADETEQIVKDFLQRGERILYLREKIKGGARAKNIALNYAKGDIIAFTDDDCFVSPLWIKNALHEFNRREKLCGIIGEVTRGLSMNDFPVNPEKMPIEVSRKADPWILGPSGGNFFIRRRVFDQVGLYDENLGPGSPFYSGEDADFVYRLLKQNLLIQFNPTVKIIHRIWRSEELDLNKRYGYGLGVGAFIAKHTAFSDMFPLYILLSRFIKKPIKTVVGIMMLRLDIWEDGYVWTKGILYGFWAWKTKKRF